MPSRTPARSSNGRPPPRQARALETRERLISAGRRAFAELGHDRVNLAQDILEPAGVSVGSFYHQFEDKTDLLLVILRESAELRRAAIIDFMFAGEGLEHLDVGLRRGFERLFDSFDDEAHGWRLQLNERSNANDRIRNVVLRGREAWVDQLAERLGTWSSADPDRRRRAAQVLVALATGMAGLYLDLPESAKARQRSEFIDSGIGLTLLGVPGMLTSTI